MLRSTCDICGAETGSSCDDGIRRCDTCFEKYFELQLPNVEDEAHNECFLDTLVLDLPDSIRDKAVRAYRYFFYGIPT